MSFGFNRKENYVEGLKIIGFSSEEIKQTKNSLKRGKIPDYVLDAIIKNEKKVLEINPNDFPWVPNQFVATRDPSDKMGKGLADGKVNSSQVLKWAQNYLKKKYGRGLPSVLIDDSHGGLANLLELYALTKYDSVPKRREVKF